MFYSWRAKRRIQKLIKSWQVYRQVITDARAGEPLAPSAEDNFLELKADIASQLQSLAEILPPSASAEASSHIAGITRLFESQLTLKAPPDSEWDQEQFDQTWQQHYLYLNKLKSMRLERHKPKVDPNIPVPTGFPGMNPPRYRSFRKVPRIVSVCLILLVLCAVVGWGFGVRWDGEDKLVITDQSVFGNSLDGLQATLNTWWSHLESLFAPVVMAYGSVVSIVLVGAFLLSLGYWVFIHS
jgi:hypothetical protein